MRLLESNNAGDFCLTKDFGDDTPRYAILSHTWGPDTEEVTFRDLMDCTGKSKAGYDKIRFCGEQARQDGIQYFWVDTCCIDKSSSTELAEAINSMFRWYRNAVKCYVYLLDVSTTRRKASDQFSEFSWESAFRESKWFTRGWTLQELLAPGVVEFFSRDAERLGDKRSLEQQVHEITGVAISALQGAPLSHFTVNERLLWAERRQTTRGEDKAYSLFGIFDIQLPLIYGEGRDKALKRLQEEIYKPLQAAFNKLQSADNAAFDSHAEEHNARCYQGTRAKLLQQIRTWVSDPGSECIFWLNGMAGTGKSTISRTVAQILSDEGELGASFFFKRGEGDRGHAGFLFTTIALQLVRKMLSLAQYIQAAIEADPAISSKSLKQQFDTLILNPIGKLQLDSEKRLRIIIVIDALDECDREEDVTTIIHLLSQAKHLKSSQLNFFLTSRPELPIRLGFEDIRGRYKYLALHQIPEPIIKDDISIFLKHELAIIRDNYNKSVNLNRRLPTDWPGRSTIQSLVGMAVPLFIFATTICRFINDRKCGHPKDQITKVLQYETKSQASKLDATYLPVLNQLVVGVTASEKRDVVQGFQQVVGSIVVLARPLSATSLDALLGIPTDTVNSRTDLLHSVLSIPLNPNLPIRPLHLSFRDFLTDTEKRETNLFWVNEKDIHKQLAMRCLEHLSTGVYLKRDICYLRVPEKSRANIDTQIIDVYLPPDIKYACQYWVYHLKECGSIIYDDDQVYNFLKSHFLHWLEALSLIGRVSESIGMIDNLIAMLNPIASIKASALLYDTKRFILSYLSIADLSPLQLYSAALIFAPRKSVIRTIFQNLIPDWISQQPEVESSWTAVLQTLEGHSESVNAVAFSHDSKLLASASSDRTIRIWDAATGTLQQTLEGHSGWVNTVAFSHDSKLLASASSDQTVSIWDVAMGALQQTLKGHNHGVNTVAFSLDSKLLTSVSSNEPVRIWDVATGAPQQTLEWHSHWFSTAAFSHDLKLLVSASIDETVKIWDVATGALQQTLEGHNHVVNSLVFSHDSKLLAVASYDKTIRIWDAATGALQQTLEWHSGSVNTLAFSYDSKLLAVASYGKAVRIWDAATGALQQTLEGHSGSVSGVVFSHDSKLLASASYDKTVRIWDAAAGALQQTLEGHSDSVQLVAFSHDSKLLVSESSDRTTRIWDAATGTLQQTFKGHSRSVNGVAFSHDSKLLASAFNDWIVRIWDAVTGTLEQTLEGHSSPVNGVAFSRDSKLLASASRDKTIRIWDVATGVLQQTLKGHSDWVNGVAFSHDSKLLASASSDTTVRIWDVATGVLQQTLKGHSDWVNTAAFSHDSKLLASASYDKTLRIWDAATGALQQDITVDGSVQSFRSLFFDATNSTLIANIGGLGKHSSRILSLSLSSRELGGKSDCEGLGISGSWVTWNGQNLLWLPPSFRATSSDVSFTSTGLKLAIGCRSGNNFVIGISLDILRSYY